MASEILYPRYFVYASRSGSRTTDQLEEADVWRLGYIMIATTNSLIKHKSCRNAPWTFGRAGSMKLRVDQLIFRVCSHMPLCETGYCSNTTDDTQLLSHAEQFVFGTRGGRAEPDSESIALH
jgi:hypothetical protein